MTKQARVSDIGLGVCPIHGQVIVTLSTGAKTVYANNLPACIVTSIGICDCGHISVAQTGSAQNLIEGSPAHRVNDAGEITSGGSYVVVSGSPDVDKSDQ